MERRKSRPRSHPKAATAGAKVRDAVELLKQDHDGDDLLDEAEVEHQTAKTLIAQLAAMSPDEDLYDAKVAVLGEYIRHHVKEASPWQN